MPLPKLAFLLALLGPAAVASVFAAESPPPPAVPAPPAPAAIAAGPLANPHTLHRISLSLTAAEFVVLDNETYVLRGRGGAGAGILNTEDDFVREDGRMIHIGGGFGGYFPWVHADISFNGAAPIRDVAVRYKGNGSYNDGAGLHRNIKVKTDLFGGKADWAGLETLNLNSGGRDPSRMRETLAFHVFRAAGVPAPRTAYAEVSYTVAGTQKDTFIHKASYGGLYTVIENVNKQFLKHALPPGTGLLMKPERMTGGITYFGEDWSSYVPIYRPERPATAAEAARVINFARLVNSSTVEEFRAKIHDYLDVDNFLRFLAVNALIMSRDSYLSGRHNFFIYLDPKDNKFRFIPWDEDTAFSAGGGGGGNFNTGAFGTNLMAPWSSDNPLGYWLLDDPAVSARYQAIVRDLVARVFNKTAIDKVLDAVEPVIREPLIKEAAAMSARGEYNSPQGGSNLRQFLDSRYVSVQAQIDSWPKPAAK